MSFYKWIYFSTWMLLLGCSGSQSHLDRRELSSSWQFRQQGIDQWHVAVVPGVVHTDLLNHSLIPHPWVGTNEKDVQWIENENWIYKIQFDLSAQELSRAQIDLVFEGLDTYAEVTLNDSLILNANNMFRTWRVPIREVLKEGTNDLQVKFLSPVEVNKPKLKSLGYELPAGSETVEYKVSPFTRKAPYHFGWDWGPRLVTAGIWRPVFLESWDHVRVKNVRIIQKELTEGLARLEASVSIESDRIQQVAIEVFGNSESVDLSKGSNEITVAFEIENPELWWPNGWGDPKLYAIPVSIFAGNQLVHSDTVKTGLRTAELVQEKDSIGESFFFKINGEPIFARGANYIPQSHFLPSVPEKDYERLIADVKNANMNMIRVWGGGIYENDIFYDLCDENGILVWQDFMFAGSMYPGDSLFIKNVEEEIIDNVKRLRNHPSIVHWNGNNEIEVAWKNWGWKKQYGYSTQDSTKIWEDYLELFHQRIPKLLSDLDDRSYTTTSPLSNWGTPENFNYGSMHYWGVWHGQDDFEDYKINVGRFMSEYGFQSFPDMKTIASFADSSDWNLKSEVMKYHQKSYVGNGMITNQIEKYFEPSADFPDLVMKSQAVQAKAMQMAIDAHRLSKGHCWGSLFWQLNDCWPGPSWSSMDVFGRKKVFYNDLKTLFAPVALIPQQRGDQLSIALVNDRLNDFEGVMKLTFYSDGVEIEIVEKPIFCGANGLEKIFEKEMMGITAIKMELVKDGTPSYMRKVEL